MAAPKTEMAADAMLLNFMAVASYGFMQEDTGAVRLWLQGLIRNRPDLFEARKVRPAIRTFFRFDQTAN
jgi:hypothetical protein